MGSAKIAGIDIAVNKAWTSVGLQMPTANLVSAALPGGPSFGINTINQRRIVILGGGVPNIYNNRIVGGIGISGATEAQDIGVANSAVRAFENMTIARTETNNQ